MNYRFEPTGEVRPPKKGEWFMERQGDAFMFFESTEDYERVVAPIYRRVPHEDTSCEVAFARMFCVFDNLDDNEEWMRPYIELECRFSRGERSPELTAAIVQITERMKGSV